MNIFIGFILSVASAFLLRGARRTLSAYIATRAADLLMRQVSMCIFDVARNYILHLGLNPKSRAFYHSHLTSASNIERQKAAKFHVEQTHTFCTV